MKNLHEIWIDAQDFQTIGGWKFDSQFVHIMGSSYLIAADEPGIPVEDAKVCVNIPESNTYRIWVRDRNWMREYAPGIFTVSVNGQENDRILGKKPSDKWLWEIAGDFELSAGKCEIALHDLSGYFGRCASILITNDFDYTPSREIQRIHSERARIKGLRSTVADGGSYDIIVAGGGPSGVPAAISAARLGCRTLLLQDRSMLGGNGSSEVGITFDGAAIAHPYARETGIAEEIRRLRDRETETVGEWTNALEKLAAQESNLTVVYDSHIFETEMDGNDTIKSVTAINLKTLEKTNYSSKIFVDCTGDGWLGYFSGAKYRYGREASCQHNESIAPEKADTITMSGCIKSGNRPFFFETDSEVSYHAPVWVPKLPEDDREFGRVINGNGASLMWWLEAPNDYDGMWDGEETRDALLLVILGYYDHIKNYWSKKERIKNYRMRFTSVFNGRRESLRMIGDYVLTQDDCTSGRIFDDAVAYSGWPLDVHTPLGIYSAAEGPLHCAKFVKMPTVPYRCLYSVNIKNLLFGGRDISATHIALGTLRVENTMATIGQAAGTAAALCIKYDEDPREIYKNHIRDLQQTLLKNDQYIPGFKNEDENDLALGAAVTCSSEKKNEIFSPLLGRDGKYIPLDKERCAITAFFRGSGDIKELYLKLKSESKEPVTVTLHARNYGRHLDTFCEFGEIVESTAVVEPMYEGWVRFPVDIKVETNYDIERLNIQIWLDKADGISWLSADNLSFHYRGGKMGENGRWKMATGISFRAAIEKPSEEIADCSGSNVNNGYSRIVDAANYEWVSDPVQKLPQWIELDLKKASDINTVSVVFDTDLNSPGTCWGLKYPEVDRCIKKYSIEVLSEGKWQTVIEEDGNFMRKRTHSFDRVNAEKVRVNVLETWGDPSARIMEIRIYNEK